MRYFPRPLRRVLRGALILAAPALIANPRASAQRTCVAPTDHARAIAELFLQSRLEATWRQVHGITATHASELQPLTDADAALCVRMDSAFVTPPSYYMRAGSYILAYNAPPRGMIYEGPTLFVFDSAGEPYYVPGSIARTGPMNLRARAVPSGQIALVWTNEPKDGVTYRVQRAQGSDAFIDLGVPIARADTTATDATVLKGNTYRYRIAALWAGGTHTYYSNVIAVDLIH